MTAEEIIPLADLVTQRRARQAALEPPHKVIDGQVILVAQSVQEKAAPRERP
jgi:hypothetical protein